MCCWLRVSDIERGEGDAIGVGVLRLLIVLSVLVALTETAPLTAVPFTEIIPALRRSGCVDGADDAAGKVRAGDCSRGGAAVTLVLTTAFVAVAGVVFGIVVVEDSFCNASSKRMCILLLLLLPLLLLLLLLLLALLLPAELIEFLRAFAPPGELTGCTGAF